MVEKTVLLIFPAMEYYYIFVFGNGHRSTSFQSKVLGTLQFNGFI
ncbi:hypothetical protein [Sediminibacillus halophilus]|nr:hypothetical protein [Sediminibacillus halophilus]